MGMNDRQRVDRARLNAALCSATALDYDVEALEYDSNLTHLERADRLRETRQAARAAWSDYNRMRAEYRRNWPIQPSWTAKLRARFAARKPLPKESP